MGISWQGVAQGFSCCTNCWERDCWPNYPDQSRDYSRWSSSILVQFNANLWFQWSWHTVCQSSGLPSRKAKNFRSMACEMMEWMIQIHKGLQGIFRRDSWIHSSMLSHVRNSSPRLRGSSRVSDVRLQLVTAHLPTNPVWSIFGVSEPSGWWSPHTSLFALVIEVKLVRLGLQAAFKWDGKQGCSSEVWPVLVSLWFRWGGLIYAKHLGKKWAMKE